MLLFLLTGEKMEEKELNQQVENINQVDDEILDLNIDPVTELKVFQPINHILIKKK